MKNASIIEMTMQRIDLDCTLLLCYALILDAHLKKCVPFSIRISPKIKHLKLTKLKKKALNIILGSSCSTYEYGLNHLHLTPLEIR